MRIAISQADLARIGRGDATPLFSLFTATRRARGAERNGDRMATREQDTNEPPLPGYEEAPRLAARAFMLALEAGRSAAAGIGGHNGTYRPMSPGVVLPSYGTLAQRWLADPSALLAANVEMWRRVPDLLRYALARVTREPADAVIAPAAGDKRFRDEAWTENPLFDVVKQLYLLLAEGALSSVRETQGLDAHAAQKLQFYTRQVVDALAPTNFVLTNPQALRRTVETGGRNLLAGFANFLDDVQQHQGRLRIRMTDPDEFELGVNIAVTPGKVVFQNALMQLIQYAPSTKTVFRRPLLIVPPWINKYYILDLRPKNSFIRWAVEQGHTVFVVSWVNPGSQHADTSFEDYMNAGIVAALDAIAAATGEREVKAIGYCLGGTLLAATLARMSVTGDDRIKAATYFVALVDFAEPGELGIFIDEPQLEHIERSMEGTGYFQGGSMAEAFNLLRANDLIWSYFVNNYLLGREPAAFDLLYWNSDSTRLPRAMHSFYLRNMYQNNLLREPGGITLGGVPIDLRRIRTPSYILATREDHIAPWRSTFAGVNLYRGPVRFVLGESGHIAGVINPPGGKYGHLVGERADTPEEWLAKAERREGSWWLDWQKWIARYNGGKRVPAREPGGGMLEPIEDAPGSYVKVT
jgi:polyhydroxyalkanoate synthase